MIKINTRKDGQVQINVSKGTPYKEFLLGIEMLVECFMNEMKEQNMNTTINDLLYDIKLIYERNNKEGK